MSLYKKFNGFIPIANDNSLSTEFECWHAYPGFAREEQDGNMDWNGGGLTAIKAEVGLPFVDLPKILKHMVKYCWEKASAPSPGVARGQFQLAGGRQAQLASIPKGTPAEIINQAMRNERVMMVGSSHKPLVQPLAPVTGFYDYLQGIANDWKTMEQLERVSAYTFRGDTRGPAALKAAGGFHPPVTRTDTYYVDSVVFPRFSDYMERRFQVTISKAAFDQAYQRQAAGSEERKVLQNFMVWRSLVENEAFHLGRMLVDEALKGYISTSRAVPVAKGFARPNGWVYLTLVRGGFLVPDKGKHKWTRVFGEQEIALPGALPWSDIIGFRQLAPQEKKFTGPIYLRCGFEGRNPEAFGQSFDLLSGKRQ